jgi:hypothetical protein
MRKLIQTRRYKGKDMARVILYSPQGQDPIEVSEHRVEYLKSKGWTSEKSKSVSKTKKDKEEK